MILIISDRSNEYKPIFNKDKVLMQISFTIEAKMVIRKVILALPMACIKDAKIASK